MSYIGNEPSSTAFLTDTFSGNGSTTAFTMSAAPATSSAVLVSITGVLQDPATYGVVGTTLTFSAAPPTGTGNISVRYLGIPASGVTTSAYRTITEFTATAGQTTFTPPSYTPGYISVFRNGALLSTTDYTASNGTTVVLGSAASAGDLVTIESFYVSSVLNALPQTGGTLSGNLIVNGSTVVTGAASGLPTVDGVHLGTQSGYATIELCGSSATGSLIDFTKSGSDAPGRILYNNASNFMLFSTNSLERMRIDSSGNIGIGTSSPSGKLNVVGSASADVGVFVGNASLTGSAPTYKGSIRLLDNPTGNSTSGGIEFLTSTFGSGYGWRMASIDSSGVHLTFSTRQNSAIWTEAMRIDSSGYVFNAVNGLGNGLHQAYQYYRLNSGFVGANSNAAQAMLGAGVTLVANTVYEFEIVFVAVKTAGTTSHTISLQFAGTATLNNILYNGFAMADNSGIPYARIVGTQTTFASNSANALAITGAITAATHNCYFTLKGTVSIANGGTFIPQYVLSAAPGGAYTTQAGSYIKISPLSASGSNTSIGTWA